MRPSEQELPTIPLHAANVDVAVELLVASLCLPRGTRIIGVGMNDRGDVRFIMAESGLSPWNGEMPLPIAEPHFDRGDDGQIRFIGWGQQ